MVSKAECSKAGKALAKNGTSAAGKKLAQCRWGSKPKKKKPGTKKPKAAPKAAVRKSRRVAGQAPVRGPEPAKKPRKKGKKKKAGGQSSAGLKKIENILVPGLNPPKGSNKAWLAEQQRIWA
jgi:hypothetical protein